MRFWSYLTTLRPHVSTFNLGSSLPTSGTAQCNMVQQTEYAEPKLKTATTLSNRRGCVACVVVQKQRLGGQYRKIRLQLQVKHFGVVHSWKCTVICIITIQAVRVINICNHQTVSVITQSLHKRYKPNCTVALQDDAQGRNDEGIRKM